MTRDQQFAAIGKAVRDNDPNEAMNAAFGILSDVVRRVDQIADALERIAAALEEQTMRARWSDR